MKISIQHSSSILSSSAYKSFKGGIARREALLQFVIDYVTKNKLINYHPKIAVLVKPLRGFHGQHDPRSKAITLDVRLGEQEMVQTFLHELRHSEQTKLGRMKLVWDAQAKTYHDGWDGQPVFSKGTTEKSYLDLPWEIDAREAETWTYEVYAAWVAFSA